MAILILGLVLFLGIHSVSIVNDPWRNRMVTAWSEARWKRMYALISVIGLVLIIWGYGLARQDPIVIYTPPLWLRHVAMLLLVPVFPLLIATYVPGRIRAVTKHPMLLAVKLWALAHLLTNGTLADVLLFGSFLIWAGIDRASLKRRTPRAVPSVPVAPWNDAIVVVAGLALYGAFVVALHGWLIGVPLIASHRTL